MLVWGGHDNNTDLATGAIYNPASNTWTVTMSTTNAPSARHWHTAVWTGSQMIVWGGMSDTPAYFNTGGIYNPTTNSWTSATSTTNAPSGRTYHTAVYTGARMIVWGGYNGTNWFNTGGKYNPTLDAWAATTTINAPSARYNHTAVWTGTEMIIWGGWNGTNAFGDGASLTPAAQP
jgi:N-acetylneuraminic acid mutarotase